MEDKTEGFAEIDGAFCVLFNNGVLRQAKIYSRKGELFARWGSGFISLYTNGATSKGSIQCRGINCMGHIWKHGKHGRLELQNETD